MKTLLTTLILIGLFSSIFAAAMWNNPVPVRKGDVLEWNRSSATTADGCVIYVWTGTRDGDRDIYAQKVNASGNIIWQQPMLVDNKPSRQSDPVITKTTDNNFIVAWYDYIDFSNVEIRTQKITSSGQKLWLSGGVLVSSGTSYEHNLKIVPDSNGGAYLSWPESRNSVSDVYGQRLDSSGNALWAYNGIPLSGTNISYYEHAVYLTTDGSLVVAYKTSQFTPNVQSLKVNLIAPDGSYSWNQPLTIVSGSFNSICEFQLCDINDSSLIIIFNAYSANDFFLEVYVHRFNLNGSLEWTNPVKVVPDIQSMYWPKVMPKGLNAGNNCVIIAWEDHRLDYDTSDIYIQKLDAGGNLLWNPSGIPVCTEDYRQYDVALISDNNGGCIIAWTDERNGGFINSDIFAQHIDTNGNILWENQGRAIGNASQIQTTPAINKISPNFFISWLDFRNGAMSIYYQVLNNNGNQLLENNGKSIHKGLPADFDWAQYKVLPRSDDAVAIWADYRHSNLGAQIYFQFINPDGSVDFTPNGKPITLSPAEYSNEFDAIVTPDDQIAIVWLDHNMIKAQLLDSSGMPLWGNDGMDVAIDPVIYKNSPKISYENGAFYIGWSQVHQAINNYHLLRITGQKLVNGIRQWGDNGIALSEDIQNEMFDSCLSQIVGRYFVWNKSYFSGDLTGSSVKMVKLVNPDGTAATGWSEAGLPASDIMGEYYTPNEAKAVATSAGLCLVWRDSRDNWIPNLYGQMISPQGIKLWNPNGIRFSDINNNVNEYDVLVRNDNLYLIWSEDVLSTNFNTTDIKLKRINLSGQSQSGEQGIVLSAGGQYIQNTNPVLQIFPNGGMLAAWEHKYYNTVLFISADNLIKHRYLNPDGSVDNTQINEVWTTVDSDTQNYPKTAIVGNDAYLFWVDADFYHNSDRCGPDYLDTRDLYVMKLSNEITSVDDEVVPLAGFTLKQNYPNPFRSETNIRFSLKQNAAVDLSVYNLKGQKITTLKHGLLDKGSHNLLWNGTDTNKTSVASGVYFIKLHSGNTTLTRKMVLMR